MAWASGFGTGFVFDQIRYLFICLRDRSVRCPWRELPRGSRHLAQRPSRPRRCSLSLIRIIRSAVLAAVLLLVAPNAWTDELNIYFKTTPSFEHLRPYADPVTLSLLVTDVNGRPLTEGSVSIRLDAPRSRVFSTDFPWVEGTRLQDMQLNLRQGRANWKYLLPIRGDYRLTVDVSTPDGRQASKEFTFYVRENERKWAALAAFSAGLFCLGVIAGRVFTGTRKEAMMLVAALFAAPVALGAGESRLGDKSALLEVGAATVGRPTPVRWRLEGNTDPTESRALLSLAIVHLEKGKTVFEVERVPVAGEFAMNFQFTDGAEYRIVAVGEQPGRKPIRSEKTVSAVALEPPTKAMIPAFGYFIGLIVLGLAAGRWSKRRGI